LPGFLPGRNLKLQDFSRGEIRAFRGTQIFPRRDVYFPVRQDFSPGEILKIRNSPACISPGKKN